MSSRPRAPRKFVTPVKYEIGKDLTHEKYEEILTALTDWFRELYPKEKAPGSRARLRIQECMEGVKKDGSPWYDADTASLRGRILSKCRFDIETMTPRRTAKAASLKKREWELDRQKRRRAEKKQKGDEMIPDALRKEMAKNYAYGEDPSIFMTNAEQVLWQQYFDGYMEQFPELSTINAKAELEALCDAHIMKARFRAKMLNGQTADSELVAQIDKSLIDMKKALGIHPDQLAKRTKPKTAMSVGEAVLRLEGMSDDKWWKIRDRLAMEEFAMLYQMYHTPRADGIGYQLDEVGLFALTKCRVIPCPKCGTEHFMGLTIEQIETYLKDRGIIEEVEDEVVLDAPRDLQPPAATDSVDSGTED